MCQLWRADSAGSHSTVDAMCETADMTLTSSMRSGGTVERSHPSMLPGRCSDKKTARKGVTRSFMPCTYPLAGCLRTGKTRGCRV